MRLAKYKIANLWRILNAIIRRLNPSNFKEQEAFSVFEELNKSYGADEKKEKAPIKHKPRILLLGPYHFKQPMWSVRANAAMPDLIKPLANFAEVHLATPIPNSTIAPSLNKLVIEEGIYHHLLPPRFNLMSIEEKNYVLDALVEQIDPFVAMNTFGVITSGFDAVTCARRNNVHSVLRVPGNELEAHKKMTQQTNAQVDNLLRRKEFYARKVQMAVNHADKVMVMSESEEKRIIEARQRRDGVFIQIRGADTAVFKPKEKYGENRNKILNVGFVGRLTLEKGTDILQEVMCKLSPNADIMFHIASPENFEDRFKKSITNLIWHGYVPHDDMPSLMEQLDVLILPSHMEGRSQTMMEAMAAGLPVLLQAKVHPEGLPGMIHCDETPASFIQALNELSSNHEKLAALSDNARQSALNYFDKSHWSEQMTKIFKQLLKES